MTTPLPEIAPVPTPLPTPTVEPFEALVPLVEDFMAELPNAIGPEYTESDHFLNPDVTTGVLRKALAFMRRWDVLICLFVLPDEVHNLYDKKIKKRCLRMAYMNRVAWMMYHRCDEWLG